MTDSLTAVRPGVRDLQRQAEILSPAPPGPTSAPVPVRDRVLGPGLFREALVRERRRADRFNSPFAVLLLDCGTGAALDGQWPSIVRAAAAVRRGVDAVGWLEQDAVLGLILSDVAEKPAIKIMHRLRGRIVGRVGEDVSKRISMRVYAHDAGSRTGRPALPSVDLLLEGFAPERHHVGRDAAKRALDIIGSLGLLASFAVVMLAASIAVRATSPGPVLFRQARIGRRGKPFTMLKFRSMYVNSADGIHRDYVTWFIRSSGQQPRTGGEVFKLTDDPRITPVGRFLRRTSLDELPQFWNVLRGEMSLVGPRPPLPFELEQYQPWHRRRVLETKPGVTGPWQVSGRSRTTFDEMVRLDLRYARTHTLWTDLKILAATPAAMISGKGAC